MADAKTARLRAEVMSEIKRHRQYAFEQPTPFRMPRDMMDAMESALDAYVMRAALVAQSECDCENPRTITGGVMKTDDDRATAETPKRTAPYLSIDCEDCSEVVDIPRDGTKITCGCPGTTWHLQRARSGPVAREPVSD